jgi:hypothetical protein
VAQVVGETPGRVGLGEEQGLGEAVARLGNVRPRRRKARAALRVSPSWP